jgi:hypothetical protein
MGRINRKSILYDGCYAHVFSRAIEKRRIFNDAGDFDQFKKLLLLSKQQFSYQIHHYCFMQIEWLEWYRVQKGQVDYRMVPGTKGTG